MCREEWGNMDMRYRLLLQQEADGLILPEQAVVAEAQILQLVRELLPVLHRAVGRTSAVKLTSTFSPL